MESQSSTDNQARAAASLPERIIGRFAWFSVSPLLMVAIAVGFVASACYFAAVAGWRFAQEALTYVGE